MAKITTYSDLSEGSDAADETAIDLVGETLRLKIAGNLSK